MTTEAMNAMGVDMKTFPAMASMRVGTVQEISITGVNEHPVHIHVNHMQITEMPESASQSTGGYFQVGDHADTILLPSMGEEDSIKVRMQIDNYTGRMVVHCHMLSHEDEGMMAF